ncbi:hypothetical protein KY328_05845 [Candidatus Woesearchaeota archaeon]|nr:hypothetical protein [Candidatus Woesearchaeota archaeon]MBW3022422.1 hypothetical protein [Candidatus Woesearchaeota archaeon]
MANYLSALYGIAKEHGIWQAVKADFNVTMQDAYALWDSVKSYAKGILMDHVEYKLDTQRELSSMAKAITLSRFRAEEPVDLVIHELPKKEDISEELEERVSATA